MTAEHLPRSLILDGNETNIETPWGLAKGSKPWMREGVVGGPRIEEIMVMVSISATANVLLGPTLGYETPHPITEEHHGRGGGGVGYID